MTYEPREPMVSQREIERKYSKLLKDVESNDFYKVDLTNRINCYVCSCKHITKTKDVDAGVTPFMINCESCGQSAHSTFFKDIVPDKPHTWEWYRPSLNQVLKMRKNEWMLDHVLMGGLELRRI